MKEEYIRNVIMPIISYIYGEINVSEVKNLICDSPNLNNDESKMSDSRPGEKKIDQKIRNIVSHQGGDDIRSYGVYSLDKTKKPASIYLETASGNEIPRELIECKKEEGKKLIYLKKEISPPQDYGYYYLAVEYVKQYERDRLDGIIDRQKIEALFSNQEIDKVMPQFGFNLMSYNTDGIPIAIIIKVTEGGKDTIPDFTTNEKAIIESRIAPDMCYVYSIYNFIPIGAFNIEVMDATDIK